MDIHRHRLEADCAKELGISHESQVFIQVGRFTEAKNHRRLISIFNGVHERERGSVLLLVGGGDLEIEHEVSSAVAALDLIDSVFFLVVRDDITNVFSIAGCMIIPSLSEGLPGARLEATAAGVPVFESNIPGVVEIGYYVSSVQSVALELRAEFCAEQAVEMVHMPAENALATTPFTLESAVNRFAEVWGSKSRSS